MASPGFPRLHQPPTAPHRYPLASTVLHRSPTASPRFPQSSLGPHSLPHSLPPFSTGFHRPPAGHHRLTKASTVVSRPPPFPHRAPRSSTVLHRARQGSIGFRRFPPASSNFVGFPTAPQLVPTGFHSQHQVPRSLSPAAPGSSMALTILHWLSQTPRPSTGFLNLSQASSSFHQLPQTSPQVPVGFLRIPQLSSGFHGLHQASAVFYRLSPASSAPHRSPFASTVLPRLLQGFPRFPQPPTAPTDLQRPYSLPKAPTGYLGLSPDSTSFPWPFTGTHSL